jgi:hypothetical protein
VYTKSAIKFINIEERRPHMDNIIYIEASKNQVELSVVYIITPRPGSETSERKQKMMGESIIE